MKIRIRTKMRMRMRMRGRIKMKMKMRMTGRIIIREISYNEASKEEHHSSPVQ